jgi:MFS family permease
MVQHWLLALVSALIFERETLFLAYIDSNTTLIAIAGFIADRTTNRRTPLLGGLVALAGSTAILCAGTSLGLLMTGRFLQGISASAVWTVGMALLSDTVEKEVIGRAMGYVAMAFSVGSFAGPLLGGLVYAAAGYYAVFAMGFGSIGLDILLRLFMIEKSVAAQWSPLIATEAVESEFTEKNAETCAAQETSGDEILPAPSTNAITTPAKQENIANTSLVSRLPVMIRLLLIPRLFVSLFGALTSALSLEAFGATLPLYVKNTFSWDSQGAGLIFICLVVPALFSPLFGHLSDKVGSRAITTVGLLGAVPFWVCLRYVTYDSLPQKVILCVLLTAIGFAVAMSMTPLMAEIDHVVELEEKKQPGNFGKRGAAAQGYGLFNTAYALGTLIGPLWAGFVVQNAGWGTMGWTLGLLSGVTGVATFWWTGGRIMLKGKKSGEDVV